MSCNHKNVKMNSKIWIHSFWFNLTTMSMYYPEKPNETMKKKYYEFVQNIGVFFPDDPLGKRFELVLNQYPITPYLDSRSTFVQWVHFVYNKIMKPRVDEKITLDKFLKNYYTHYMHHEILANKKKRMKIRWLKTGIILLMIAGTTWAYKK